MTSHLNEAQAIRQQPIWVFSQYGGSPSVDRATAPHQRLHDQPGVGGAPMEAQGHAGWKAAMQQTTPDIVHAYYYMYVCASTCSW